MEVAFWNKDVETLDRGELEHLQFERLKSIVQSALNTSFYSKRLKKIGISSADEIKCLKDLQKIPFTTKDDLRQNFPKGLLAVDFEEVVRIHSSSGTTGIPTVIYLTAQDLDNWTDLVARCIVATGACKKDVFRYLGAKNLVERYRSPGNAGLKGFRKQLQTWRQRLGLTG